MLGNFFKKKYFVLFSLFLFKAAQHEIKLEMICKINVTRRAV